MNKLSKLVILLMIGFTLSISSPVLPNLEANITDTRGDVISGAIDILSVSREGSYVVITTESGLTVKSGRIATFLILFDSDLDDNVWEAAIAYSFGASGVSNVAWLTTGLSTNPDWQLSQATNDIVINTNVLKIKFSEFPNADTSSIAVISMEFTDGNTDLLVDWAPDRYNDKISALELVKLRPISSFGYTGNTGGGGGTTSTSTTTSSTQPGSSTTTSTTVPSSSQISSSSSAISNTNSQTGISNKSDSSSESNQDDNGSINTSDFVGISIICSSIIVLAIKRKIK